MSPTYTRNCQVSEHAHTHQPIVLQARAQTRAATISAWGGAVGAACAAGAAGAAGATGIAREMPLLVRGVMPDAAANLQREALRALPWFATHRAAQLTAK